MSMIGKSIFICFLIITFVSHIHGQTANFVDVSDEAGINAVGNFHGVAIADYDLDGLEDIFLSRLDGKNILFRNMGNLKFTESTNTAGLGATGNSLMSLWFDHDNDGDPDLYIGNFNATNQFFENNGDGSFTEKSVPAGLSIDRNPRSILAADFNLDGYTDLYLANISAENNLMINDGDGSFTDMTQASGATDPSISMGAVVIDYDNDGDPDLYLTHDANVPFLFYENDGQGNFIEKGSILGLNYGGQGMGVDFLDIERDGDWDIYVTNLYENNLFRQGSDGTFTDLAGSLGLDDRGMGWGVVCMDHDNDGYTDIYINNDTYFTPSVSPNKLFHNNGDGTFTEIAQGTPLMSPYEAYANACADFNRDGLLDLIVVNASNEGCQLFENRNQTNNNWLQVKLIGQSANRDAIGARLIIHNDDEILMDEITAGSGYGSQNAMASHLGLGQITEIDSLEIWWPGGDTEMFQNIPINQLVTIRQGEGIVTSIKEPTGKMDVIQLSAYQSGEELLIDIANADNDQYYFCELYALSGQKINAIPFRPGQNGRWSGSITISRSYTGVYLVSISQKGIPVSTKKVIIR